MNHKVLSFSMSCILGLISVMFIAGCSSSGKLAVKPNEHIEIGWTPRTIFQAPGYAAWFDSGYSKYQPQQEYVDRLKGMRDSTNLVVVYGTWCSDSKREIPRFYKMIDATGYPQDRITLIAVDRTMQFPEGIKKKYAITNVPTFMVHYRGVEVGRIIELPKTSLEQDIEEMLAPFFPR